MKATTITNQLTAENIKMIIADEKASKSAKVRMLFDGGLTIKEICTLVGIRYNFAYNVIQNYCIQNGIALEKVARESKRSEVIELLKSGKTLAEVSREMKMNYNQVWKIAKEEGLGKKKEEKEVAAHVG